MSNGMYFMQKDFVDEDHQFRQIYRDFEQRLFSYFLSIREATSTPLLVFLVMHWLTVAVQICHFVSNAYIDYTWSARVTDVLNTVSTFVSNFPVLRGTLSSFYLSCTIAFAPVIFSFIANLIYSHLGWWWPFVVVHHTFQFASTMLFIPTVAVLCQLTFGCLQSSTGEVHPFFPNDLKCGDGKMVGLAVLGACMLVLHLFCSIAAHVMLVPTDLPKDINGRNNALSRVSNRAETLGLLCKCVLLILFASGRSDSWRVPMALLMILVGSTLTTVHLHLLEHFSATLTSLYVLHWLLLAWVGVVALLTTALQDAEGTGMLFFLGLPLLALLAVCLVRYRHHVILGNQARQSTSGRCYVLFAKALMRAFARKHGRGGCWVDDSPALQEAREQLFAVVEDGLGHAVARFPDSMFLRYFRSSYYLAMRGKRVMAFRELSVIDRSGCSADVRYYAFAARQLYVATHDAHVSPEMQRYLEFRRKHEVADQTLSEASRLLVHFWGELLREQPSVDALTDVGHLARGKLQEAIRYYQRLLEINPESVPVLRTLGLIHLNLTGGLQRAAERLAMAEEVEHARRVKQYAQSEGGISASGLQKLDIFDENNAVITISVAEEDFAQIKHVNRSAVDIFGYASGADLVNRNINTLMPREIGDVHDGLLHAFLQRSSTSRVVGHVRTVFGQQHVTGYLIPVNVFARWSGEATLVGVVQPVLVDAGQIYLLVDPVTMTVRNTTVEFYAYFGYSRRDIHACAITLPLLMPVLADEDKDVSDAAYRKLASTSGLTGVAVHASTGRRMGVRAWGVTLSVHRYDLMFVRIDVLEFSVDEDEDEEGATTEDGQRYGSYGDSEEYGYGSDLESEYGYAYDEGDEDYDDDADEDAREEDAEDGGVHGATRGMAPQFTHVHPHIHGHTHDRVSMNNPFVARAPVLLPQPFDAHISIDTASLRSTYTLDGSHPSHEQSRDLSGTDSLVPSNIHSYDFHRLPADTLSGHVAAAGVGGAVDVSNGALALGDESVLRRTVQYPFTGQLPPLPDAATHPLRAGNAHRVAVCGTIPPTAISAGPAPRRSPSLDMSPTPSSCRTRPSGGVTSRVVAAPRSLRASLPLSRESMHNRSSGTESTDVFSHPSDASVGHVLLAHDDATTSTDCSDDSRGSSGMGTLAVLVLDSEGSLGSSLDADNAQSLSQEELLKQSGGIPLPACVLESVQEDVVAEAREEDDSARAPAVPFTMARVPSALERVGSVTQPVHETVPAATLFSASNSPPISSLTLRTHTASPQPLLSPAHARNASPAATFARQRSAGQFPGAHAPSTQPPLMRVVSRAPPRSTLTSPIARAQARVSPQPRLLPSSPANASPSPHAHDRQLRPALLVKSPSPSSSLFPTLNVAHSDATNVSTSANKARTAPISGDDLRSSGSSIGEGSLLFADTCAQRSQAHRTRVERAHLQIQRAIACDNKLTEVKLHRLSLFSVVLVVGMMLAAAVLYALMERDAANMKRLYDVIYASSTRNTFLSHSLSTLLSYIFVLVAPQGLEYQYMPHVHPSYNYAQVAEATRAEFIATIEQLARVSTHVDLISLAEIDPHLDAVRNDPLLALEQIVGKLPQVKMMSLKEASVTFSALSQRMLWLFDTQHVNRGLDDWSFWWVMANGIQRLRDASMELTDLMLDAFRSFRSRMSMQPLYFLLASVAALFIATWLLVRPIVLRIEEGKTQVLRILVGIPRGLRHSLRRKAVAVHDAVLRRSEGSMTTQVCTLDSEDDVGQNNHLHTSGAISGVAGYVHNGGVGVGVDEHSLPAVRLADDDASESEESDVVARYNKRRSQMQQSTPANMLDAVAGGEELVKNTAGAAVGTANTAEALSDTPQHIAPADTVTSTSAPMSTVQGPHVDINSCDADADSTTTTSSHQDGLIVSGFLTRRALRVFYLKYTTFVLLICAYFLTLMLLSRSFIGQQVQLANVFIVSAQRMPSLEMSWHFTRLNVFTNYTQLAIHDPRSALIRAGDYVDVAHALSAEADAMHLHATYGSNDLLRLRNDDLDEVLFGDVCSVPRERFEALHVTVGDYFFLHCRAVAGGVMQKGLSSMWHQALDTLRPLISHAHTYFLLFLEFPKYIPPPLTFAYVDRVMKEINIAGQYINYFVSPLVKFASALVHEQAVYSMHEFSDYRAWLFGAYVVVLLLLYVLVLWPMAASLRTQASKAKSLMLLLPPDMACTSEAVHQYITDYCRNE